MSINIISSNKLHKADAIIRPFCTDKTKKIFTSGIKSTNSREDFFKYEIKASFPIYSLKNGKDRFKKCCIKCLKAAAKKDCETVIIDLKLPDNLNNLQKVVYNEVVDAATAFLAKVEIDILLFVGDGNFTLSDPDLLSEISKLVEEHFGCQTDGSSNKSSNNEYAYSQPCKSIPDDDDNYCSFGNLSSVKCVDINCACIKNNDIEIVRNDRDNDDICSFGEFLSEKRYVVDCFGARDAETVHNANDDEELCFLVDYSPSDEGCHSFGEEFGWNSNETKYQDSDDDPLSNLQSDRHLHTKDINNITTTIISSYSRNEHFADKLMRLIDSKGMDCVVCYKKANVSRQTWSQIKNNPTHKPNKITVLSFAFALELTLDETQELLASVGQSLSYNILFDYIVIFFLKRRMYNISALNEVLYDLTQKTLNC